MKVLSSLLGKIPKNSWIGQFIRYLFTGGLAFIADFGLFALCLYVFEWHYLLANLVGLIAGLILNYALSVAWVFADCKRSFEKKKFAEFAIFTLIGIAGVGINQLLMFLMVGKLELQEMLSKMIAAIVVLIWNFGARKLMLFRAKKEG